ncbi:MAG: M20/M25/M40 family metallo-hydrolase [Melioribacteraceae bacterium]|nr:M20/M25/M40 family metallo-hydrolase [Melioribacteraceae bacterium]
MNDVTTSVILLTFIKHLKNTTAINIILLLILSAIWSTTKMKATLSILLLIFSFSTLTAQDNATKNIASTIKSESLINTVKYLSSPELEGRLSGSKGYFKAAQFMADEFKSLGLLPVENNNYFQSFKIELNEIIPPSELSIIVNGLNKKYKLGRDYVYRGFSGSGDFNAEVVFVGYGMSIPAEGYDDYNEIDVKDKWAMMFKYSPSWRVNDTINWSGTSIRGKAHTAVKHGAKGVLFVSLPNSENPQKPIGSVLAGEEEHLENIPLIHIDIPVADEILSASGFNLSMLQTIIDSTKSPNSIRTKTHIKTITNTVYNKNAVTVNVVGFLEGNDEVLKNEYIVVGGHLDHVGQQAGEIYFPGANDNASGSAGVLELARAFSKIKDELKRSIIFVLFASEEAGLYGAQHYVNNPPFPLEKTVAMINMDCIGYGDSIRVGNGLSAPNLFEIAKQNDKLYTKMMVDNTWKGGGADATPFHRKSIPSLYFVTTNSYDHLHWLTDTYETLNPELFERLVQLVFYTVNDIASGDYKKEEVID